MWCNKCQGLTFVDSSHFGVCAAGGYHNHDGSGVYLLAAYRPGMPGQGGWRQCTKCLALTFVGGSEVGACPAGGTHDNKGRLDFTLGFDPRIGQPGWRWCNKCQMIWYMLAGSGGACPGGGEHDYSNSSICYLAMVANVDWNGPMLIQVIDAERPDLGGNYRHGDPNSYTPQLWRFLIERFNIRTMLDVGAGEGHCPAFFHRHGVIAHGIEGMVANIDRAVYPIALHDLTRGAYRMPVDLVTCVEVVEHIDQEFLSFLLDTLTNGRIICMTHAVPGQGGHHHVNEQPAEYWLNHLRQRGYTLSAENETFRHYARQEIGDPYFGRTGLLLLRG
jgi:hypothetical protein